VRYARMFTNSLLAGALGAAYLTVLVLQLNPHVPLLSATTARWFATLGVFYGVHLAVTFYVLIVVREFFSMDAMSPGWASVRVLAWLSATGAAVAAAMMWLNADSFRAALGETAARRMMAGAFATTVSAIVLLGIAIAHYSSGRRASRVGGTLFSLAALASLALPLAARGPAVQPAGYLASSQLEPWNPDATPPPRIVMVMLDGASLEYIRTSAAEGGLPNFSRLLEAGASMYLATVRPTQPGPVWAAAALPLVAVALQRLARAAVARVRLPSPARAALGKAARPAQGRRATGAQAAAAAAMRPRPRPAPGAPRLPGDHKAVRSR